MVGLARPWPCTQSLGWLPGLTVPLFSLHVCLSCSGWQLEPVEQVVGLWA